MLCDLHTHSLYSDGSLTPEALVAEAKKKGIIIALTDHNTASGLAEFMTAAESMGVTAVAGTELSTVYKGRELHLIGLFIEPRFYKQVDELTDRFMSLKLENNLKTVEKLNRAGYRIDVEAVKKRNLTGRFNRAHVAAELLACGYVSSVEEAFDSLLREGGEFYSAPPRLDITGAIRFLRDIGAVPILAHPLQELTEAELRAVLPELKEAGLIGIETRHSSYGAEAFRVADRVAADLSLLASGGSDFHGEVKPLVRLGDGMWNLAIPEDIYFALLKKRTELYPSG
ncbi:MAG: PHP domain-containing protein [Clostridia bacterium]|nr:PHP domain-containing protein [Clostridia bacterium]